MSLREPSKFALLASLALNVVLAGLLIASRPGAERGAGETRPDGATRVAAQPPPAPTEPPPASPTHVPPPTATIPPAEPSATAETPAEVSPTAGPPTATAAPDLAASPTAEPTPMPSPTPAAEPTLAPTPEPTAVPDPGPDWLRYLNRFRQQSRLPAVIEDQAWSTASYLHSVYMVNTGQLWHDEDINSPFYTVEGLEAARNSNIAAADISVTSFQWAFNFWISAPFHAVPMLDPELGAVGFGLHRDANGRTDVAATLDVRRGIGPLPAEVSYPIMFPGDGGQTWVLKYALPEFPLALASCQGYQQPSGPPIILQIGRGDLVPDVSQASLRENGNPIDFCLFHEANYYHPDAYTQRSARTILDQRDAIVMIPRRPFAPGNHFEVQIVANGLTYGWSFDSVAPPT